MSSLPSRMISMSADELTAIDDVLIRADQLITGVVDAAQDASANLQKLKAQVKTCLHKRANEKIYAAVIAGDGDATEVVAEMRRLDKVLADISPASISTSTSSKKISPAIIDVLFDSDADNAPSSDPDNTSKFNDNAVDGPAITSAIAAADISVTANLSLIPSTTTATSITVPANVSNQTGPSTLIKDLKVIPEGMVPAAVAAYPVPKSPQPVKRNLRKRPCPEDKENVSSSKTVHNTRTKKAKRGSMRW